MEAGSQAERFGFPVFGKKGGRVSKSGRSAEITPLRSWEAELDQAQEANDRLFFRKFENRQEVFEAHPELEDLHGRLRESPDAMTISSAEIHEAFYTLASFKLGEEEYVETSMQRSERGGFQIFKDNEGLVVQYAQPTELPGEETPSKVGFIDLVNSGQHEFHTRVIELDSVEYGDEGGPSVRIARNGKAQKLDLSVAFLSLLESSVQRPAPQAE